MTSVLGLSTYMWNNNLKSIALLLMFPILLLALLGGIFYAYGLVYANPDGALNPALFASLDLPSVLGTGRPEDLALAALYHWWPIVVGIACIWVLIGYAFNDSIIHLATGAKEISRSDAPKLYNMLENLCISRGMKTPTLYVMETGEMNAYASGINERSYAITVTRGLIVQLSDREMEAVLAHELTHIINRDCRLLIITIVFVGMISFLAQLLWRSLNFMSYRRNDRGRNGGGLIVFMLIASVILGIGYVLGLLLRFALSRKREYLADAGSVELTKNPDALIGALRKISCACSLPQVPTEVRQMFIENPPSIFDMGGLFATHPPIGDRIHVLEALGGLPPEGKSVIPSTQDS
jgi:heat shock protein HtpX